MSQENVETVRGAIEGFNRGEIHLETLDPGIEWHTTTNLPDATTHRGHAPVGNYLTDWSASFDEFAVTAEELRDVGDCVAASMRFRGRIKGSDDVLELSETHVWKFRDGRAIEVWEYTSHDEAIQALESLAKA
jgi:ketosteroid isomerase-like protein